MYSFDTSVFMDWQARLYPPDVFISLVSKIEGLVGAGQCSAIGQGPGWFFSIDDKDKIELFDTIPMNEVVICSKETA